jgi:hypothetical protein
MRNTIETTADQRALDRAHRRAKTWQPAERSRKPIDRETIRHHNEETKFISRRAPR